MTRPRIRVCRSSTCRTRGGDAVLVEVEELAALVDGTCAVGTTGCLGRCRRGPALQVVDASGERRVHSRVDAIGKSAAAVADATGRTPPPLSGEELPPDVASRIAAVGEARRRGRLAASYRWNGALADVAEGTLAREDLRPVLERILSNAGYRDMPLRDLLRPPAPLGMPKTVRCYATWRLRSVEVVSEHSAIFGFETDDPARGTPHPRGRRVRTVSDPTTWHMTMLGEVGANDEGPLPWVERDYTPVSTARDWERGRCDLLVKVYDDGQLTPWLRHTAAWHGPATRVRLSRPLRTLSVPSLAAGDDDGLRPRAVLLLLAGTGIVALPQVLAHYDPTESLGVPIPAERRLECPVDLIQSCRADDVLLLPRVREHCREGAATAPPGFRGVRNYTLLITGEAGSKDGRRGPFHGNFDKKKAMDYDSAFDDVPNAEVIKSRLNRSIIANATKKLSRPYRIVVSGPDSFNGAARTFLEECGVESAHVTMLSA